MSCCSMSIRDAILATTKSRQNANSTNNINIKSNHDHNIHFEITAVILSFKIDYNQNYVEFLIGDHSLQPSLECARVRYWSRSKSDLMTISRLQIKQGDLMRFTNFVIVDMDYKMKSVEERLGSTYNYDSSINMTTTTTTKYRDKTMTMICEFRYKYQIDHGFFSAQNLFMKIYNLDNTMGHDVAYYNSIKSWYRNHLLLSGKHNVLGEDVVTLSNSICKRRRIHELTDTNVISDIFVYIKHFEDYDTINNDNINNNQNPTAVNMKSISSSFAILTDHHANSEQHHSILFIFDDMFRYKLQLKLASEHKQKVLITQVLTVSLPPSWIQQSTQNNFIALVPTPQTAIHEFHIDGDDNQSINSSSSLSPIHLDNSFDSSSSCINIDLSESPTNLLSMSKIMKQRLRTDFIFTISSSILYIQYDEINTCIPMKTNHNLHWPLLKTLYSALLVKQSEIDDSSKNCSIASTGSDGSLHSLYQFRPAILVLKQKNESFNNSSNQQHIKVRASSDIMSILCANCLPHELVDMNGNLVQDRTLPELIYNTLKGYIQLEIPMLFTLKFYNHDLCDQNGFYSVCDIHIQSSFDSIF